MEKFEFATCVVVALSYESVIYISRARLLDKNNMCNSCIFSFVAGCINSRAAKEEQTVQW